MSLTFSDAPLAEIIAEVRWTDPTLLSAPGAPVGVGFIHVPMSNAADEFYMRFGGAAYAAGFRQSERLVPPGFPVPPGQVTYRYRTTPDFGDMLARSALWQIGSGVFTANAVPPYKSWVEFAPWVEKGVQALIETRSEKEKSLDFSSVSLRYIDAFTEKYLADLSFSEFLEHRLGFKVTLPAAIEKIIAQGALPEHIIQFSVPVKSEMVMTVMAAKGQFNGADAIILNTTVGSTKAISPTVVAVMERLNTARDLIHNSFVELTSDVHPIMKPLEEN